MDDEWQEAPAFGEGAGRDGRGGVHECDLEEEHGHDPGADAVAGEHEALRTEEAEVFAEEMDRELGSRRCAAENVTAEHEAEADEVEAEDADGVDHQIHRHRVGDILGPRQSGLDEGEAGLHEEDQEAGKQHPDHVDGDAIAGDRVGCLGERRRR